MDKNFKIGDTIRMKAVTTVTDLFTNGSIYIGTVNRGGAIDFIGDKDSRVAIMIESFNHGNYLIPYKDIKLNKNVKAL